MLKPYRLRIALLTVLVFVVASAVQAQTSQPVPQAQTPNAQTGLSDAELEVLVGPIALYPDALVANILPAATVPLDIVAAARYLREQGKKKVEGAPPGATWDPSVIALLDVPDAIYLMDKDLKWTQRLGDAVIEQQEGVMTAGLHAAGHLRSRCGGRRDHLQQLRLASPPRLQRRPPLPLRRCRR